MHTTLLCTNVCCTYECLHGFPPFCLCRELGENSDDVPESFFLFSRDLAFCAEASVELERSGFQLCEVAVPADETPAELPRSSKFVPDAALSFVLDYTLTDFRFCVTNNLKTECLVLTALFRSCFEMFGALAKFPRSRLRHFEVDKLSCSEVVWNLTWCSRDAQRVSGGCGRRLGSRRVRTCGTRCRAACSSCCAGSAETRAPSSSSPAPSTPSRSERSTSSRCVSLSLGSSDGTCREES